MKIFAVLAFFDLALLGAATRMQSLSRAFTAQATCWEAPHGGTSCHTSGPSRGIARRNGSKKLGIWYCWETAQGQIHCKVHKRDAFAVSHSMCLASPGNQIHCNISERMMREIQASEERTCWQADDNHIHCIITKNREQYMRSQNSIKIAKDDLEHRGVWERSDVPSSSSNLDVDPDCTKWYSINKTSSNTCVLALSAGDITLREFRQLNPPVNLDCTNLKINTSYCIKSPNIAIFPGAFGDETSTARPVYAATRNSRDTLITIQTLAANSVDSLDSLVASVVSKLSYMRTNDALSTAQISTEEACYTYNLTSALSGLPIATQSIDLQPALRKTFQGQSRTARLPCGKPTGSRLGTSSSSSISHYVGGAISTEAASSTIRPIISGNDRRLNLDNPVQSSVSTLPQSTSQAVIEAENGHVGAPGYPPYPTAHFN